MKNSSSFWDKFTESKRCVNQAASNFPVLELAGDCRLLIENHFGVVQYSKDGIKVKLNYGKVYVGGSDLQLQQMTKERLLICGRIDIIRLERGEGN